MNDLIWTPYWQLQYSNFTDKIHYYETSDMMNNDTMTKLQYDNKSDSIKYFPRLPSKHFQ